LWPVAEKGCAPLVYIIIPGSELSSQRYINSPISYKTNYNKQIKFIMCVRSLRNVNPSLFAQFLAI